MEKQIKKILLVFTFFAFCANTIVFASEADRYMLIPGGDAIGIHIKTAGVIVVDTYQVETVNGKSSPAAEAGLAKGDIITAINGQRINSIDDYKKAIAISEGALVLTVRREEAESEVIITGYKNKDGQLTTGVYLRDQIAGIGTLTYIDPATYKYAALGHEIIDQDTNKLVEISQGELVDSDITSIKSATSGEPGEKIAEIYFNQVYGTIEKNNQYGIYGKLTTDTFNAREMLPIAYQDEITLGRATILTVIDGKNIEEFEIEIIDIDKQPKQDVKGIKYLVKDLRLIQQTGGIVQGMSGSPIIQNGKIIGAVTHVLVHDSTLGYGVFIEWMLKESQIDYQINQATQALNMAA